MNQNRTLQKSQIKRIQNICNRRVAILAFICIMAIVLGGCHVQSPLQSDRETKKADEKFVLITNGYVVDTNDSNQILVVSSKETNSSHDASWVSIPTGSPQITLGTQVKVYVKPGTGIDDPYPRNFTADQIEVEPEVKPNGATLSRAQAVSKALEQFEADEYIPIVLQADYDRSNEKWKIKLKTDQLKSQPVWQEVADAV